VVGGITGVFFFDTAFEVFHRLFFPAGTYLFDPRTDRLVQLFPEQFWVETTVGVGVLVVLLSVGLAWFARGRAARLER
jgi:integral membrane protein (TIGR01906 family)